MPIAVTEHGAEIQPRRCELRRLLHRHLQLLQGAIELTLGEKIDAAQKCRDRLISRGKCIEGRRTKTAGPR
jgi:hypothetical protein